MLTAEQLEARRSGIGSSEIAAILGENPYANAHSVWLDKMRSRDDEWIEPAWWGSKLEPIIGERYEIETGAKLSRCEMRHLMKPDGTPSIALASPDFVICDSSGHIKKVVECKAVFRTAKNWDTADVEGVPEMFWLQGNWQCGVLGVDKFDLVVWFAGICEPRIFEYDFDRQTFGAMLKVAERFWNAYVVTGNPPPVDDSEHARRALEHRYPQREPLKDAPPDAVEILRKRLEAEKAKDAAEKSRDLASNQLREMIGESEGMRGPWGWVSWKVNKAGQRPLRVNIKRGVEL